MELSGELDNLEVGNSHFGKDFFQSVQFDHSGLVVLTREQAESVLYIRWVKLTGVVERENLLELRERDFGGLLENVIKLLGLLVVGDEPNHLENSVETFSVQFLLVGSLYGFKLENLTEVLILNVVHTRSTWRLHIYY